MICIVLTPLSYQKETPELAGAGGWRSGTKPPPEPPAASSSSSSKPTSSKPSRSAAEEEAAAKAAEVSRLQALKEASSNKNLSTGEQIKYAMEKLSTTSPAPRTMSESSSKSTKEEIPEETWYDEDDEDQIDCFDLTI